VSMPQAAGPEAGLDPRRWVALAILLLASFMNLIDVTIVNVALPSLQRSLGASSAQIEWVVAAYVLAFALALLPFGRLGDIVGRRRMFLLGVTGFTLASALCGLAPSIEMLIAARVLQGLASAMMTPQVLAIVQVIFPPRERGQAFSFFGLTAGLASVAGPIAGGALIHLDLGGLDWRPIFLVNIPIGILAVVAGQRLITRMPGHASLSNDFGGIALFGAAILLLVFPLIEGRAYGWPLWAFAMIAAALLVGLGFYLWEKRRDRRGLPELLPVSLIENKNFVLGTLMTMVFFSGIPGLFFVLALFLQSGFGLTPLESGLTTLPFPLGVLLASAVNRRLGSRLLPQRLAGGALVLALGMLILKLVVGSVGDTLDHWIFVPPLLIAGFGMGNAISALFQTILSGVPPRDAGAGSGALQAFQQVGGALGVALVGEIFFGTLGATMGAGDAHAAYRAAGGNAMVYEIAAFLAVAALVPFLKPLPRSQGGAPAAPVVAEA